eukprot:evm.model.scf_886.2 EVM.evm.TU.scf_886.2   scf_886:10633-23874(-)
MFPIGGLGSSAGADVAGETAARPGDWLQCRSYAAAREDAAAAGKAAEETKANNLNQLAAALLSSSSADDSEASSNDGRQSHRHREHKRKRKRAHKQKTVSRKKGRLSKSSGRKHGSELDKILEIERQAKKSGSTIRRSTVEAWLGEGASVASMYYFHTQGDINNLVYGGLYRPDIPGYRRVALFHTNEEAQRSHPTGGAPPPKERFFSGRHAYKERDKKFRRLRVVRNPSSQHAMSGGLKLPPPAFIPLTSNGYGIRADEHQVPGGDGGTEEGLTAEESVLLKTKEFNSGTRERPYDLSLWLAFADFQDHVAKMAHRKSTERSTAERKIAILERALMFHPSSDELVLKLLKAVESIEDPSRVMDRWERVLQKTGGSPKLWLGYVKWRKRQFASFSVQAMQRVYARALEALSIECSRRRRLGVSEKTAHEVEEAMVAIALMAVQFDLQAGYTEHAVAKVQAMFEFQFFSPGLPSQHSDSHAIHLFESFWKSGAPRVGEVGGMGWRHWVWSQAETRPDTAPAKEIDPGPADDLGGGGWSGWQSITNPSDDSAPAEDNKSPSQGDSSEDAASEREYSSGGQEETDEEESDTEALDILGLRLEEDLEKIGNKDIDSDVLIGWLQEEHRRECLLWAPERDSHMEEADIDVDRIVEYDDIQDWVFAVSSQELRERLVGRCLELLGMDFNSMLSSGTLDASVLIANSHSYTSAISHLVSATGSSFVLTQKTSSPEFWPFREPRGSNYRADAEHRVDVHQWGFNCWYLQDAKRSLFVCNLLSALLTHVYPDSPDLAQALVRVTVAKNKMEGGSEDASRECVKTLLSGYKENLVLWNAYAQMESESGKLKVARKVYDTTLGSLASMPPRHQGLAPLVVLSCVDSEVMHFSTDTVRRVLHVLTWLGTGGTYTSFKKGSGEGRDPQDVVSARVGFQSKISEAVMQNDGAMDDVGGAWVACAALFELFMQCTGAVAQSDGAGRMIVQQVARSVGLDVRRMSRHHELLQIRYCRIIVLLALHQRVAAIAPSTAREAILEALATYPSSAALLALLVHVDRHAHTPSRLTRCLHNICISNTSPLPWISVLAMQHLQPAGQLHMPGAFERALSHLGLQDCPVIWRCYLLFEIAQARGPQAKRVFLRGIRNHPWVKKFWVDGFAGLMQQLGEKETGELMEIMREKGVRTYTDVYEIMLEKLENDSAAD